MRGLTLIALAAVMMIGPGFAEKRPFSSHYRQGGTDGGSGTPKGGYVEPVKDQPRYPDPTPTTPTTPTPPASPPYQAACPAGKGCRDNEGPRCDPSYGERECREHESYEPRAYEPREYEPRACEPPHHRCLGNCKGAEDMRGAEENDRDAHACLGYGLACSRDREDAYEQHATADGLIPKDDTDPKMSDFVLYGERSVDFGYGDHIAGGDVGVHAAADPGSSAQMKVGSRTRIEKRHTLLAPSVQLGFEAYAGDIQTASLDNIGGFLTFITPYPAKMPPIPLALPPASGGSDVTVDRLHFRVLTPGAYRALKVDGEVSLQPGTYSFASVVLGDGAQLIAEGGGAEVRIGGTMATGWRATIRPRDCSAAHLKIFVSGYDGASGTPSAVSIGDHTRIAALLTAPHGTLVLGDEVSALGAFAGFDVRVGNRTRLDFEAGFPADDPQQHGQQQLNGYVTPPIASAAIVGPVPAATEISLAIGLPVQNLGAMRAEVQKRADPASPLYRKPLSPAQVTATFGPAASDYQGLITWAQSKGLSVVKTYPNRLLVDVKGTAAQVEQALFADLNFRRRPDGTSFYAVDREPSLDFAPPVLRISGLDNRVIAVPGGGAVPIGSGAGAGPGGTYNSSDIRIAYASCSNLTGTGQSVGLFELDGFTANDISAYECQAGGATCSPTGVVQSPVPAINTVLLDSATGLPTTIGGSFEAALDIEMAVALAPGLSQVQVFEAPNTGNVAFHNDVLNSMATAKPLINQISSSWFFTVDSNSQQILYQLALQGQSFFQASGDEGSSSWTTDPGDIRDQDAVTVVGGTTLTLAGAPSTYKSETPWNIAGQGASGGGIAANVTIPGYQSPVSMATNGGSTTNRNLPDVAAVATNLAEVSTDPTTKPPSQSTGGAIGTSAAAPLWAAFVALANQQSLASGTGTGTVGNANAFLYHIGQDPAAYKLSFNDIVGGTNAGVCTGAKATSSAVCSVTSGTPPVASNTWATSATAFAAVTGYDLATGLGTPQCAMIKELATGTTTALPATPVTITYHQVGACNGFATSSGTTSAGVNQAYVIFGVERIDNSGGGTPFNFVPTNLFVQQGTRDFVDPSLAIYPNVLGPFASVASTVVAGNDLKFGVTAQNALVVQTVAADGATEADKTPYALRYNGAPTDPPVLMVKSDAARTSWPLTQDCKTITLN